MSTMGVIEVASRCTSIAFDVSSEEHAGARCG